MLTIREITKIYKNKIDFLDLEILIANSLKKTREFVLTYPEQTITRLQETKIKKDISRRMKGEPIAYIVGHKEFYGLDFIVNKHTLVPRPETEMIVELVTSNQQSVISKNSNAKNIIIDIGTGSGNIIISIAKTLATSYELPVTGYSFFATDISKEALKIAKKNAKLIGVDKKIKFLHGDLLKPLLKAKKLMPNKLIITANLPYLSKEIYQSAPIDVKKFEPKSALYSAEAGLAHYGKLLQQIQKLLAASYELRVTIFLEISPEQKQPLMKLIKNILPKARMEFKKDLAGKWRICKVTINVSPSP
ncbi:MAG: Release factor glutamine methyltransferase [Candidatus Moranbacteria bacterium GW2011_GWE1_36_7]|nr:MAG: Release factor glutamine methyltransferase [Candidatus Moranbacteria bacterium GW2011_GWE2_36_40]KKQ13175.1 MAG: Release factor glutamine methyltransferase [Candidatus Moranbacteria bacterium GW2011_GWE1_36_7]